MRIGPYEVVTTLGEGGAGVVYGARSPDGREVAIKVLRKNDPETQARFERERRLLGSFGEAEGFVPLLDAGTTPHGSYLVMPFVPGGTLRKRLEAGPLPVEAAVALGRRLAEALGAAHARGVVHRDMKPENVLFTTGGRPLIADLGLAKHFDPSRPGASQSVSLSVEGALRGTAGYMAPEQMADAKAVGPAADVFALGAILYEALAGEPPFLGENSLEVLARVASGTFDPLGPRTPEAPAWLVAAVERALARAPRDRFADGLELGRALAAGHAPRRSRLGWAIGLASAVVIAFVLVARARPRDPVKPKPAAVVHDTLRAREAADRAEDELRRGDWPGAIADYTRAIELAPELAVAWQRRGFARDATGDHDRAIADLDRAIQLDPKLSLAWGTRGEAKMEKGDNDGAIADLTRAIELDPKLAAVWSNRGAVWTTKGDDERGLADVETALELDPRHALAWAHRGRIRRRRGDRDGAIADYTRALELDPGLARTWTNRGWARQEAGDFEGAMADFGQALARDPKLALAWAYRGGSRSNHGDQDGAIEDLDKAVALDANLDVAWVYRGTARLIKGDNDGAIADFTRATEVAPEFASVWQNRGVARERKGDLAGAIADFEHFLEIAPGDSSAPALRERVAALKR